MVGAGVLGSLYAGCLAAAGHDVALLARDARLEQVRRDGLACWPKRPRVTPSRLHRSVATGLAQDPLDLANRNPEDLGNLRDGHAVLQPDAYPGNL